MSSQWMKISSFIKFTPISLQCKKYCSTSDNVKKIGWVQSVRSQKKITFIDLLDGRSLEPIQVVASSALCPHITLGCCLNVAGQLKPHKKLSNVYELVATNISILGHCPSEDYPLGNTHASINPEVARHSAIHLRHRRPEFAAVLRLRSALKNSIRNVMENTGYLEVDTPLLTSADCEGAGEAFSLSNKDYFGKESVNLTVSAQLHLEVAAAGLGKCYTLSPTFRADKSRTRHHLSEFYMLEAESIYLHTTKQLCDEIESTIKSITRNLTEQSSIINSDLPYIWRHLGSSDKSQQIQTVLDSESFPRLTFQEGLNLLLNCGDAIDEAVDSEAVDFTKRQEQYLISYLGNVPLFITDFPAISKPFYCLTNENSDSKMPTAAAVDLLLPDVGEVVGGSVREHRLDKLLLVMAATSPEFKESFVWYSDLRKYGTCPHAGYGLGFDRFMQWLTGIPNLRDTVFLPRSYDSCLL